MTCELINRSDLGQQRICNQKLAGSEFRRAVEVVGWMGAVQAQDFGGAKWALGLRMKEATNEGIEKAFNEGQIVRTHLLRPTWHFVAPEDIRWLLELTAPRVNMRCGPYFRRYELDGPTLKSTNKILTKALQGGKHLTRTELKAVLNRAGVAADDGVRLGHILLRAELDAVICSGPRIGKQFTYALFEQRVPATKPLPRDEALAKLTRTYFNSHGPATLQDFIWWSGLTTADARSGIALLGKDLENTTVNDKAYFMTNSNNAFGRTRSARTNPALNPGASQPDAWFLPAYDEYNVAYKHRDTDLNVQILSPTVMLDGRIIGNWKATVDKKLVTINVNPATSLTKPEALAITKAADRYASFLGLPADVHI